MFPSSEGKKRIAGTFLWKSTSVFYKAFLHKCCSLFHKFLSLLSCPANSLFSRSQCKCHFFRKPFPYLPTQSKLGPYYSLLISYSITYGICHNLSLHMCVYMVNTYPASFSIKVQAPWGQGPYAHLYISSAQNSTTYSRYSTYIC